MQTHSGRAESLKKLETPIQERFSYKGLDRTLVHISHIFGDEVQNCQWRRQNGLEKLLSVYCWSRISLSRQSRWINKLAGESQHLFIARKVNGDLLDIYPTSILANKYTVNIEQTIQKCEVMNRDNPRKDEDEQRLLVNSFAANSDRYKGFSSCWRFTGSPPQLASFAFRLASAHKIPFADVTIGQLLHIHIGMICHCC